MLASKGFSFKAWMVILCFLLTFTAIPFQAAQNVAVANVPFNEAKIYYKNNGFTKANIHYRVDNAQWTKVPGVAMTQSPFPGFFEISVPLNGAGGLTAAFNNGANIWDNNKNLNYRFAAGVFTLENGVIRPELPVQVKDITPPSQPGELIASDLSSDRVTISWQASQDNLALVGYEVYRDGVEVADQSATSFTDSGLQTETTYTYTVIAYDYANNRSITSSELQVTTTKANTAKVYYKVNNGTTSFIHFRPTGGNWTTAPGLKMSASEFTGFNVIDLNIGAATTLEAVFNNGSGVWDNNKSSNYALTAGTVTVADGKVTAGAPDVTSPPPPPPPPTETNSVTVYYETKNATTFIHYRPEGGTWTKAPGVRMDAAEITGYAKATINIGAAQRLEAVFNNGSGVWDNNKTLNYMMDAGTVTIAAGKVTVGAPTDTPPPPPPPPTTPNTVVVYYGTSNSTTFIHYRPEGGTWTTAPGVRMEAAEIAGYAKSTINIGAAQRLEAVFNNGSGVWDNNKSLNYMLNAGTVTVENGKITVGAPNGTLPPPPPPPPTTPNTVTLYYATTFANTFIHYRPEGGKWTVAPGVKMETSEVPGFAKATIDIGAAQRLEAVFNNGASTWDNNGMKNYLIPAGNFTLEKGAVKSGVPVFTPLTLEAFTGIGTIPANGSITPSTDIIITAATKPVTAADFVRVIYTTDDGQSFKSELMTRSGVSNNADNWQFNIGKLPAKTEIVYQFIATDYAGNVLSANNPETGNGYKAMVEDRFLSTFPQMYLRGTNNNFDLSGKMQLVADYAWQTKATFKGTATDRFKFDVNGNWFRNYGDNNNDRIADLNATSDIFVKGGEGEYIITFNDRTLAYTITPPTNKVTSVKADYPTYTLKVGDTDYLSAQVSPAIAQNKDLTWTSSNPEVVEVVDGIIKAKAVGEADVVIASVDNPLATATTKVTVIASDLHPVFSDPNLNYVFDKTALPEITIEISTEEWNKLLTNYDVNRDNEIEVAADYSFTKDGKTEKLTNIGFRLRGNTSRMRPEGTTGQLHNPDNPNWNQASFAFKFSKFNKSQRFYGMQDLNVRFFREEPLHARDVYSYDLHRRYNVWTAPMSSYAKINIKIKEDQKTAYYGVYEMVEAINQDYLNKRFAPGNNTGNLWKGNTYTPRNLGRADFVVTPDLDSRIGIEDPDNNIYIPYDLKTNKKTIETVAKPQLVKFLNDLKANVGNKEWLEQNIDIDLFLRYLAVHVSLGNWDDFWNNGNNMYFYFDNAGKFHMVPYDYDNTLGISWHDLVADAGKQNPLQWGKLDDSAPLALAILSVPEFVEQYKQHLMALINPEFNLFDYQKSATRIQAWHNLIRDHIQNDTGDNMILADQPPAWGSTDFYRTLSGDENTNFFRARANAIRSAVLGSTVYYQSNSFSQAFIHYQDSPNGAWTKVPGNPMQKTSTPGLFVVNLPGGVHRAVFNNGAGVWDNNGGKDYSFGAGNLWTVRNGLVTGTQP